MYAHNMAEKTMFAGAIQDKARHLSYGFEHLRYAVAHQEDKALVFTNLLGIGERIFLREISQPVVLEPLAVIFGGGVEGAPKGMKTVHEMMRNFVHHYLSALSWIGIDRSDSISSGLSVYISEK